MALLDQNCPAILYKYVPPETWVRGLITGEGIKFSSPLDFNDPFEGHALVKSSAPVAKVARRLHRPADLARLPPAERLLRRHAAARRIRLGLHTPNLSRLRESFRGFGMLCLSSHPDSALMWAHYARSHEGAVIGFRTDVDFFQLALPISYCVECPQVDFHGSDSPDFYALMRSILFSKADCWAYEGEWRIMKQTLGEETKLELAAGEAKPERRALPTNQDGPGMYRFERRAVARIIAGARSSEETRGTLAIWAREAGLDLIEFPVTVSQGEVGMHYTWNNIDDVYAFANRFTGGAFEFGAWLKQYVTQNSAAERSTMARSKQQEIAERAAESKRLTQEGLSLREAAEVLEISYETVRRDVSQESSIDENRDTRTHSQRTAARQVYLPADVTVAARKIRAKFGEEFSAALARELRWLGS